MVFPRFNPNSFWNLQALCDIRGARCPCPPLGLITVAALLPPAWNIRLINRNAEELTDAHLDWADVVFTGGMLPQQPDTLALIELCRKRGLPVVVGGPDATSSPEHYRAADFLVLGEAEGILDQFVDAWSSGRKSGTFEAEKFQADVTTTPVPRFDLLKQEHYVYRRTFSRDCPFTCEFCDIIELYGVPRQDQRRTPGADAIYRPTTRHVDFVDDTHRQQEAVEKFLRPDRLAEDAALSVHVLDQPR